MSVRKLPNIALTVLCVLFCLCAGCVQRKLTIVTEPAGALVLLNDEEIGISPVTVGFEWYGDYTVRISKDGFQTINTHQNLKRPLDDFVGIDLIADICTTKTHEYTWTFKLDPYQQIEKDELIKSALSLQKEAFTEVPGRKTRKK